MKYETSDVVLMFAELQSVFLGGDKTVREEHLTRAVGAVVGIARELGIPVFSSTIAMGPPDSPVEMIEPVKPYRPVIRKTVGLLEDETIVAAVAKSGRRVLAVGGVSSEIAILHSVLGAVGLGYRVFVLTDCCTGLSTRSEAAAFRQMEAAGATLSNLSSFFSGLVPRLDDPTGQVVFSALGRFWRWA